MFLTGRKEHGECIVNKWRHIRLFLFSKLLHLHFAPLFHHHYPKTECKARCSSFPVPRSFFSLECRRLSARSPGEWDEKRRKLWTTHYMPHSWLLGWCTIFARASTLKREDTNMTCCLSELEWVESWLRVGRGATVIWGRARNGARERKPCPTPRAACITLTQPVK